MSATTGGGDAISEEQPVWARDDAFPRAGEGYGWVDRKGGRNGCGSFEELSKTITLDRDSVVNLVWTPESEFCRIPEEVEDLSGPIAEVRKGWAGDDLADAAHRMRWFGGGFIVLAGFMVMKTLAALSERERTSGLTIDFQDKITWVVKILSSSTTIGISLLGFLIFAFIPWYQAWKRVKEMRGPGGKGIPIVPLIRFETWLEAQKAPMTKVVLGIISVVFLGQVWADGSLLAFHSSVMAAGLEKGAYRQGEWWRLFTAPMLHGGVIHFGMNALALLYLGKRLEVFARWPHVPLVFLFSALVGGEASARLMDTTSVGASGGLMGWLGFLLVFETLHGRLVPRSARRRLLGGVIMTGLIGLIGYRFIDNAAHFGGLLAGMIYAGIVFPKSGSVLRPRVTGTDRILGGASLLILVASAAYAAGRLI